MKNFIKRFFDFFVAFSCLLLFFIPLCALSLFVRYKIGSPIFFSQLRPGLNEKPFVMYKFRTMTNETDASGNLLSDEKRLTAFGKWLRSTSLDELPELFNVLKGNMSLVGPRPLLMEYIPLYNETQRRRHHVRPGMTGWAQVNGRNALSWDERFKLDVWYVDNHSFWLDLKIIFLTLKTVIARKNINAEGHATMEKFGGNE